MAVDYKRMCSRSDIDCDEDERSVCQSAGADRMNGYAGSDEHEVARHSHSSPIRVCPSAPPLTAGLADKIRGAGNRYSLVVWGGEPHHADTRHFANLISTSLPTTTYKYVQYRIPISVGRSPKGQC